MSVLVRLCFAGIRVFLGVGRGHACPGVHSGHVHRDEEVIGTDEPLAEHGHLLPPGES